jgi:putative ABC transport system permease protein
MLFRSLRHYARWHVALALGAALASMAILGSLFIGDSVRGTLAARADSRLQKISHAVSCGDGFLNLAAVPTVPGKTIAPVLMLPGTVSVSSQKGSRRQNGVRIYGVDDRFWLLGQQPGTPATGLLMNAALADRLSAKPGEQVVLRVEKPSLISRDAPLSGEAEATVAITEKLAGVVGDAQLGTLNLAAEQTAALNVFLPLSQMAKAVEAERGGQPNVNLLLADTEVSEGSVNWRLADVGMDISAEPTGQYWVLKTGRIFFADQVVEALRKAALNPQPVFTYLATELRADKKNYTAYPLVAGISQELKLLATPLKEGEMAVNQWTADSLKLKVGDTVNMAYYSVTEARSLREEQASFRIRDILPMETPGLGAQLTPDFPGFSQAANCRDWKAGIPIKQQGFIRLEDEAYWKTQRATPKAVISLGQAEKLWQNRFGKVTSLWIPRSLGDEAAVQQRVHDAVKLADLGFVFVPAAAQAKAAVDGSMDFGGLFLAMSCFLIATALVLVVLLFLYNVEGRAGQVGLLRASGFTAARVRRLFIFEFLPTLVVGALLGWPLAKWYQHAILTKLSGGGWQGAVAGLQFIPMSKISTVANGLGMTVAMGLLVLWFASKRLLKATPATLLAGGTLGEAAASVTKRKKPSPWVFWGGVVCVVLAAGMAPAATQLERHLQPGVFFGAAGMLLLGGVFLVSDWLRKLEERQAHAPTSVWALGLRQAVRRRGRSLAVAGLLAAGVFMVTAMHTMHADARKTADPGTGGFAFLASCDTPIYEDLNTKASQEQYGLEELPVSYVQFKRRPGEEASCLNLNKAQVPSVLGVNAASLQEKGRFPFSGMWKSVDSTGMRSAWQALDTTLEDGAIPAIVDLNSAMWALKKKLGDVVEVPNGLGGTAKLRLVAFLKNTILQGHVIISEKHFGQQFPDTGGYKLLLINAPPQGRPEIASKLTRQLQTKGLSVDTAENRLAELQAVQNAYLQIFSALGGLGLLLSTVALGLLIGRNVLERQGELALLSAAGFTRSSIRQLILAEFVPLFLLAFVLGVVSAALAIWPHVRDGSGAVPWALLGQVLGGILLCGVGACVLAAWWAMRKPTLQRLSGI